VGSITSINRVCSSHRKLRDTGKVASLCFLSPRLNLFFLQKNKKQKQQTNKPTNKNPSKQTSVQNWAGEMGGQLQQAQLWQRS